MTEPVLATHGLRKAFGALQASDATKTVATSTARAVVRVIADSWVNGYLLENNEPAPFGLARATMESHTLSYEFFSNRDLLLYAILSALTGCWEKAGESYRMIFEKNPNIFLKENLLKPRNFWLMQALVYKKIGQTDYYKSFLRKAEEIDPYWNLHKFLLGREIVPEETPRDCVPLFHL